MFEHILDDLLLRGGFVDISQVLSRRVVWLDLTHKHAGLVRFRQLAQKEIIMLNESLIMAEMSK